MDPSLPATIGINARVVVINHELPAQVQAVETAHSTPSVVSEALVAAAAQVEISVMEPAPGYDDEFTGFSFDVGDDMTNPTRAIDRSYKRGDLTVVIYRITTQYGYRLSVEACAGDFWRSKPATRAEFGDGKFWLRRFEKTVAEEYAKELKQQQRGREHEEGPALVLSAAEVRLLPDQVLQPLIEHYRSLAEGGEPSQRGAHQQHLDQLLDVLESLGDSPSAPNLGKQHK